MKKWQKQLAKYLAEEKIIRFGNYTVRTGEKKPFRYKAAWTNNSNAIKTIAKAFIKKIKQDKLEFDALLAISYSAIPIVSAIATEWKGKPFNFAYDKKQHNRLIGEIPKNAKVLVIDDSLVTGEAKTKFLKKIKKTRSDLKITAILVLLDFEETAKKINTPIHSCLTIKQAYDELLKQKIITNTQYKKYLKYRKKRIIKKTLSLL